MARIAGIDLPKNKKLNIALRYVYGVGPYLANEILKESGIDTSKRVKELNEAEVNKLNSIISQAGYSVEGDLRREVQQNIKRLIEISSYRGLRHRRNLPCRGQRTRTNARIRRGRRKTVGASRAAAEAKA